MGDKKSYTQIVKSTSLFGGVQVIQILSTIIRGKLVALFLGTTGMGINTLYNSVITLVVQFSSFGLNFSAVRDISNATEKKDEQSKGFFIIIFKRWMFACSILGAIIMSASAYLISRFTFGNGDHTLAFVSLSIVVIFSVLGSCYIAILQGSRQLKDMAKASVIGSLGGLGLCVPLYYYLKESGIVPALIASALSTCLFAFYYSKKISIISHKISLKDTIRGGTEMAKLGFAMMLANLIGSAVNYFVTSYIGHFGSIADVGLYGAAMSITNQYVGLIFSAMAVDYFPRLSAIANESEKVNSMVNEQAEIVILIMAPMLIGMIVTAPIIITVLLSTEFLSIQNFVVWAALAMLFKAAAFSIGYISFAKGDKKVFLYFEGVFNSFITLAFTILGYRLYGVTGIAIAILCINILYLVNVNILAARKYGFKISKSLIRIFIYSLILVSTVLIAKFSLSVLYFYLISSLIFLLSSYFTFTELDKRVNLKSYISKKLKLKSK